MSESFDVVVIGGGQAGLAMSYHLKEWGIDHVVLEAGRIGETWRSQRWDSFCLVTPNFTLALPGMPYDGLDPDGFAQRDDIVAYIERYQKRFALPVRTGVRVESLERSPDGGYALRTSAGSMRAGDVVVAAGAFPKPNVLPASAGIPSDITQIHTIEYRNPAALPAGAILVVGSGQSGAQIAEELHHAGRRVFLAMGSCGRAPRRYRGRDIIWWFLRMGFLEKRVDQLDSPVARFACKPYLSGKDGGHEIDVRALASDGMTLLGRLRDASDGRLTFAASANGSLEKAEAFGRQALDDIDAFIARTGLDCPAEPTVRERFAGGARLVERESVDLREEGITTVVWATGYRPEFPWVRVPVFDENGYPVHRRGVTESPGLYFLGLAFLHRARSDTLFGVGDDAAQLAGHIAARRQLQPARAIQSTAAP